MEQRTDRSRQSGEALNRGGKLATWQRQLDSLYQDMEACLKGHTESGRIKTKRRPTQLTGDDLDSGKAQTLAMRHGEANPP